VSRKRRWLLEVILAVLGIQAFYGGIQLMRDAFAFPVDWLDPLPFDSWVIPGLLLMALIGVPAFGLLGLHVADNRYADPLTVAFGCGIMAWILVQLADGTRARPLVPLAELSRSSPRTATPHPVLARVSPGCPSPKG